MRVMIVSSAFAPERELAALAHSDEAGAVASFVGYCRGASGGLAVDRLELEHYPDFTEAVIRQLADEVFRRHDLIDLLVVHRIGAIPAGDAIVLVAASSAHRAAALAAVSELMDYLKTEAPIWKKEIGPTRSAWIEPTAADRKAVASRRTDSQGRQS